MPFDCASVHLYTEVVPHPFLSGFVTLSDEAAHINGHNISLGTEMPVGLQKLIKRKGLFRENMSVGYYTCRVCVYMCVHVFTPMYMNIYMYSLPFLRCTDMHVVCTNV